MELSQATTSGSIASKKGRGPTTLSSLSKADSGSKKTVEYNIYGQPIGDNSTKLSSYCGVLGRNFIPISIDDWRSVPVENKEKVWKLIQEKFVVDESKKKAIMQGVGIKWRGFKNKLTSLHIYPYLDDHSKFAKPPAKYQFIKQEDWDEFVKQRLSPEFYAKREAQLEKQAKNICNHRISRKGYARYVEELKSTGGYTKEVEPDRSFVWKKARQNKKGEYINPATKEKADLIDELMQQLKDGEINTQGSHDILAMALDNPEHPGRVRGVGHFITPTSFFGIPKRSVKRIPDEVQAQLDNYAQFVENTQRQMTEMGAKIDALRNLQATQQSPRVYEKVGYNIRQNLKVSIQGSRSLTSDPISKPGQVMPCYLCLENRANIVANGTYFESMPNVSIHGRPLGEGNVCVSIVLAVDGHGHDQLPYPLEDEGVMCVNDAIGYIVEWQRAFVLPFVQSSVDPSNEIEEFAAYYRENKEENIVIEYDQTVFPHDRFTIHLVSEDIIRLVDMEELSAPNITVYMGYLADQLIRKDKENKFGLANPYTISIKFLYGKSNKFEDLVKELAKVYNHNIGKLILVPMNIGVHWVLLVLDFRSCTFYYFDSLRHSVRAEIKTILNRAIQHLKRDDKTRKFNNVRWENVKCPQQSNNKDCGYYVLRNMKEIVEDETELSIGQMFNGSKVSYSKEEIDEVRIDWIRKVKEYLI